jgi:uncharacterized protein HemX
MQLKDNFVNRISLIVNRKKQFSSVISIDDTRLTINQNGVGLAVVVIVVALVLAGVVAVATPQIRNSFLPAPKQVEPSPSASASQYSEKQKLYIRNEEAIKKGLNLTDQQFDLLVQNADKN